MGLFHRGLLLSIVVILGIAFLLALHPFAPTLTETSDSLLKGGRSVILMSKNYNYNSSPLVISSPQRIKTQESDLLATNHSSYVLALGYCEQISAGTSSVLQLSTLAHDFGASLVEPTIVASHIFGIEGVYPTFYKTSNVDRKKINMFALFNKSRMNDILHSNVSPSVNIVPFSSFIKNAPRNISIFHFNSMNLATADRLFTLPRYEVMNLLAMFEKTPNIQIMDCLAFSGMKSIINQVESQLNAKELEPFKVTEAFCFNHNHIYRSDQLLKLLPSPRTIIFTNWGGCGLKDCTYSSKDVAREKAAMDSVPHIRHAVLTKRKYKVRLKEEYKLHNNYIESLAVEYLEHLGYSSHDFVAVHVRMERVIRHALESHSSVDYSKCLNSVLNSISGFAGENSSNPNQQDFHGSRHVLVVSDMPGSEFGSDTCSGRHCNLDNVTKLRKVFGTKLDFQSFDPSVLKVARNAGLVSLVEMHMLSMGKKLILVGYGGFQAVLETLFLSRHHNESDVQQIMC